MAIRLRLKAMAAAAHFVGHLTSLMESGVKLGESRDLLSSSGKRLAALAREVTDSTVNVLAGVPRSVQQFIMAAVIFQTKNYPKADRSLLNELFGNTKHFPPPGPVPDPAPVIGQGLLVNITKTGRVRGVYHAPGRACGVG
jgi:hypothetical protein